MMTERRHRKETTGGGRVFRQFATGLVVAGVAFAVAMGVSASSGNAQTKTLTYAMEGPPTRLDPHTHALWLTYRVVYHMFESFVQADLTNADVPIPPIVPALAESWDVTEDQKHFTFNLRQGVTFHDGTPWNAEAAKFNFDRLLNPDFEFYLETAVGLNGWWIGFIESYEVLDEYTFRVNLNRGTSNFLARLVNGGYGSSGMVSPTAVRENGNDGFNNHPIGSGPFKFVERVHGERIVLEKNADYWDPKRTPKYDRLIYRPIAEDAAREIALTSGSADIIASPSPDSFEYLESQGINIVAKHGPDFMGLWLNTKDPVVQDVRVRRAMAMAIDRDGICNILRSGECIPSYGLLHIKGPGYDPDYRPFNYDPEGAKALLAEAGYPDGIDVQFDWPLGGGGASGVREAVEWIQRDFEKVGIRTGLRSFDVGTYFDQMLKGMPEETEVYLMGWGETSYIWLEFVVTPEALPPMGYNSGYYNNPMTTELLNKVNAASTEEDQVKYLRDLQDILNEDMPFVPLLSWKQKYAMSPRVKGFVLAPEHWVDLSIVDIVE
jgi:peptide/nickel transport system substrate-binding protein